MDKRSKKTVGVQPGGDELRRPGSKLMRILPVGIIIAVSFLVYFNTLFNGFVYDDNGQILGNPWIRDLRHLPEIFYKSVWSFMSAPSVSNYYRPMMHVIYMINYHIFGLKPWGFHLANVLFHAGVSVMVFFIAERLLLKEQAKVEVKVKVKAETKDEHTGQRFSFFSTPASTLTFFLSPPFIAALLFATHPIHTEAVAWAGAITDISFTFFSLLSFSFYIRYREDLTKGSVIPSREADRDPLLKKDSRLGESPGVTGQAGMTKEKTGMTERGNRYHNYLLSVVSFFLAALCKEPALTLPVILMAYDFSLRKNSRGREILFIPPLSKGEQNAPPGKVGVGGYLKIYLPYFVVACIYLILRFNALGSFSPVKVHGELTMYQILINVFPLFVTYLEKLLFPLNLNAFHVLHPLSSMLELKGIIAIIITAAYAAVTVIAYRKNRTAFFCLVLIFIPLLPVFYIPALGESSFAERYLYLPSAGFVVLLAMSLFWLYKKMARYGPAIILVAISVAGLYSFQTMTRNPVWKNDLSLFTDTVRKSPDGELPNGMLGIALMGAGRFDEAAEQFRKTLKLNPNSANAYYNLGLTLMKKGLPAEAIPEFQKALALTPEDSDARRYLAEAYAKTGMTDKAGEQHRILMKSGQTPPEAYIKLGIELAEKGRAGEAIEQYKKALAIDPDYVDAHYNLGAAYANTGKLDKALEHMRRAVELQPGNAFYRNMLGITYGQKGTYAEAVGQFREAVRLAPSEPAYRKNLERAEGLKGSAGKK